MRQQNSFQIGFAEGVLSAAVFLPGRCGQQLDTALHVLCGIHTHEQCFPQQVFRIRILFFDCFVQPVQSAVYVLRYFIALEEQPAECVCRVLVTFPRRFQQAVHRFIGIVIFRVFPQEQFAEAI